MARGREYRVVGVYARRRVADRWFWWVLWAPPHNDVGRTDHWQPEESFVDTATINEVWDLFEAIYPRRYGGVCLLPIMSPAYHYHLDFPFSQFGLQEEDPTYHMRTQWALRGLGSTPTMSTTTTTDSDSE